MEKTEFLFPDEASENPRAGGKVVQAEVEVKGNEVDIEVVDDTPVEDRNRKPMEEPPKEALRMPTGISSCFFSSQAKK